MAFTPLEVRRARRRRFTIIVGIAVAVEAGLAVLSHLGPALSNLIRPVYVIVAMIAAFSIWHAFRRHPHQDRRQNDRRSRSR